MSKTVNLPKIISISALESDPGYSFSPESTGLKTIEHIFLINGIKNGGNDTETAKKEATSIEDALREGVKKNSKRATFASYGNGVQNLTIEGLSAAFSDFSKKCGSEYPICIVISGDSRCSFVRNELEFKLCFTPTSFEPISVLFEIFSEPIGNKQKPPMAIIVASRYGSFAANSISYLPEKSVIFGFSEVELEDRDIKRWVGYMLKWPSMASPMDLMMVFLLKSMKSVYKYTPTIATSDRQVNLEYLAREYTNAIPTIKTILRKEDRAGILRLTEKRYGLPEGDLLKFAQMIGSMDEKSFKAWRLESKELGVLKALLVQYIMEKAKERKSKS